MGSSFNLLHNCIGCNFCNCRYFCIIFVMNVASTLQCLYFQNFIIFHVVFKLLGVNAFKKLKLVHNLAATARKAIYHHFELISKVRMTKNKVYEKGDLAISGLGVERRALPLWRTIYFGWHQHGLEECFRHKIDNMILFQANISKILKILHRNTILFVGANLWADGAGLLVDRRSQERLSPRSEILGDNPTEVLFPNFRQTS